MFHGSHKRYTYLWITRRIMTASCRRRIFCFGLLLALLVMNGIVFHPTERSRGQTEVRSVSVQDVNQTMVAPVVLINHNQAGLKHVLNVFRACGYSIGDNYSDWDVFWSHSYPFDKRILQGKLKPHQKINHFPANGKIVKKEALALSNFSSVPKAFKVPKDKEKFLSYAKKHPDRRWVEKNSGHRGIKLLHLNELDLQTQHTFVQEFIEDALLIDGRRFDIGVYTTLVSVDPLRVYINQGDWLIRFCPEVYHPFDPTNLDKYVVSGHYKPMWEIDSLIEAYEKQEMTRKETLITYLTEQGLDFNILEENIMRAIREVYLTTEPVFIGSTRKWGNKRQFFEMVRFDFVVRQDLNVYLMEANMSPNLSSSHLPHNSLLYEQVVFGLLGLVGLASKVKQSSFKRKSSHFSHSTFDKMQVSIRDIKTFNTKCLSEECMKGCRMACALCKHCLDDEDVVELETAYMEHQNRGTWRRVFPRPFTGQGKARLWNPDDDTAFLKLNPRNQWMSRWFHGKCLQDATWCL